MKRIVVITLFTILALEVILPRMDVNELGKLPALISHYKQHRKKDAALTFLRFIDLHYNDPDHHDKDHEAHQNLPFSCHHNHNCQLHLVLYTLPESIPSLSNHGKTVEKNAYYSIPVERFVTSSIWQPPRS